jgi:hypothetical protein
MQLHLPLARSLFTLPLIRSDLLRVLIRRQRLALAHAFLLRFSSCMLVSVRRLGRVFVLVEGAEVAPMVRAGPLGGPAGFGAA